MTKQQLARDYADSIAGQLWELDSSGDIFPHDCERDEDDREELSCEEDVLCEEHMGVHGYLADILDIEYRVSADKDYRSAKVMIAFGGPTAWIDTSSHELIVVWDEQVSRSLPRQLCNEIDNYLEELFSC